MPVLNLDDAEIHYREFGKGYPLVLFAPGHMRSRMDLWWAANSPDGKTRPWNNWTEILASQYRIIAMDQRNAGASKGAIEADHGWHTYAADQIALLDHLGIDRCHVLGVCIGPSFIFKLLETIPERFSSMVLQNPVGVDSEFPDHSYDGCVTWADQLCAERPELDQEAAHSFSENMWKQDFVFSVDQDFVRTIDLPSLVMPGDDLPHPAHIGIEIADILPGAECLMDWKRPNYEEPQRHKVVEFLAHYTP